MTGARPESSISVRAIASRSAPVAPARTEASALPRMVMRQGGVRPGCDDDREGERVGALVAQGLLQPPGNVCFGPPHDSLAREPVVGGRRDAGGAADRLELGVVLHRAQ